MVRLKLILWVPVMLCMETLFAPVRGQNTGQKELVIRTADSKILLDGRLTEPAWQIADSATGFWQNFPFDSSLAGSQTVVKACFDERNLYFGVIAWQKKSYIVRSLKRDYEAGSTDLVFFNINPFRDRLNSFYFTVSPLGTQKEGLISNGTEVNVDWDNKWYCAVKNFDDHWEAEVAIPFKTLRYRISTGVNTWEINFGRNDLTRNERSSWVPVPRNFRLTDANFTGTLVWNSHPPVPGSNISLIPYILGDLSRDFENNTPAQFGRSAGLDAKVAITPSLNLDLTFNPDFAQVEVDQQVTNLSRFELFFPERRQFFLENSDLFGSFGTTRANPFFSRRIGLITNSKTEENEKVPIIAGARLSGRINKDWRIGILDMQTKAWSADSLPSSNYLVAAVQRRVFRRSNLAFILVNRQGFRNDKIRQDFNMNNKVIGIDMNMASGNGRWQGKWYNHYSFSSNQLKDAWSNGMSVSFSKPGLQVETNLNHIGNGFNAETGFVPRTGIIRQNSNIGIVFFPKGRLARWLNNWSIIPDYDITYGKPDKRITDWDAGLFFGIRFQNSAEIRGALLRWDYTYLFEDFDPTNKDDSSFLFLKQGTDYRYFSNRFTFRSNARKNFYFNLDFRRGGYFNGRILSLQTEWNYRWQPYGIFSLTANYTRIRMPEGYNRADFWLVGPRIEITFTKNIFWTTFIQYNNQVNNMNINSRFQWRYKPVSDLFIVYTDNYFVSDFTDPVLNRYFKSFAPRNRALVIKMNYWLNL